MLRNALLTLTTLMLLSSCGGQSARGQGDGDTLALKYSKLLTIVSHQGYTVADIRNPWHKVFPTAPSSVRPSSARQSSPPSTVRC